MRIIFTFFFGLLLAGSCAFGAEPATNPRFTGTPFLRKWQSEDYQASPVNWAVTQDARAGFIYVANNYGLLEFDGPNWKLLEMPSGGPVRSFTLDAAGNGWAGGLREIAFFPASAHGLGPPISLGARLPDNVGNFSNVTRVCATPAGVFFAAGRQIFRFHQDEPAQVWTLPTLATQLWWQEEGAHVALSSGEIWRFENGQFTSVAPALGAGRLTLHSQRRASDGSMLFLTSLGSRRWRGPGQAIEPVDTSADDHFTDEEPVAATFLADGSRVYGFLRSGVRLFNSDGKLLSTINEAHGLASNRIEHLFSDEEGGVWIAQRSGLVRLQLDSPFALHGGAVGLAGSPRVLTRHFDRLYVAHNEGVDWRDSVTGRFQPVPGIRASISSFLRVDGKLFGVGASLYEFSADHQWRPVLPGAQLAVFPIKQSSGDFLAGNSTGVSFLRYADGAWTNAGRLTTVDEGVTRFRDGGDGWAWGVAYDGSSIWQFDYRGGISVNLPTRRFTFEDGLPAAARRDSRRLVRLGNEMFATSANGTRRFDAASGRFVRELGIENISPDTGAIAISSDEESPWWFTAAPNAQLGRIVPGQRERWRFETIASGPIRSLVPNTLFHDAAMQTLWIASQGQLVSADLTWQAGASRPPLRVIVRDVFAADHRTALDVGRPLPSTDRSLRFSFSAPTFEADLNGKTRTVYRTYLEGLDAGWSEWSDDTWRDVTNLPYRSFVFRVQARALDGRESAVTEVAFSVAPPWWLRPWMLACYALAAGVALVAVYRWRTHSLRQRNLQLEAIVAARTAELNRLRQIDRDESIAAKLAEEKARLETLRYQLNPHFLYNALNSIRALIYQRPPAAGEMVQQLADLCRITLTRHEEAAPVADELAMLRLYLEMEKTRWRNLLEFTVTSTPEADRQLLPPFLLLPLVENALKHGRAASSGTLHLQLTARIENSRQLVLEVANSGAWLAPGTSPAPSTGIGLENLRQRLERYYPSTHEITVDSNDGWVRATLRLPLTHG